MDLESTDRDKFDDGQEVFGVTYCPGGDLSCGYGDLPRSSDSGYVGSTLPAWVKAPGNHPLVAAFPIPEIDVVPSSFHVQVVTTVTTDHVITSGTEESYSTSTTEGTSTSVADTVTWNEWQEVSKSLSQKLPSSVLQETSLSSNGQTTNGLGTKIGKFLGGSSKIIAGTLVGTAGVTGCGTIIVWVQFLVVLLALESAS